jgi:hypothetical protein
MAFDKMDHRAVDQSSTPPTLPSPNSKERLLQSVERLKEITKCARILFSAYPTSDYDDPKGALASYVEVLSDYSDVIVQHVTSNKTGIQRRSKFPPRIAELVAACDEAASRIERHRRYVNWGRNNQSAIEGPQAPKPSYDELIAKYGPNFGLDPNCEKSQSTTFYQSQTVKKTAEK